MDEVLKYIFEYLVMGQLKFGMENRFIILLKYNQNCPQQQSPSALLLLLANTASNEGSRRLRG